MFGRRRRMEMEDGRAVGKDSEVEGERMWPTKAGGLLLVGCVKTKADTAMHARELYRGALFDRRREYAEGSVRPWYILSARWGLVAPDELIAPYDLYLGDCSAQVRTAWGRLVAARLAERHRLNGRVVEIHAGSHYVEAIRDPLTEHGARLRLPLKGLSLGRSLAWYQEPAGLAERLSTPDDAIAVHDLRTSPRLPDAPGLYSWWVDEQGATELSEGAGVPVRPGVIYVGQTGATHRPSGKPSRNTLRARLLSTHLGGRAEGSTFRWSLAAVLAQRLGVTPQDERALTPWMERHLSVVPVAVADRDRLGEVAEEILRRMNPPLNLSHVESGPLRARLKELRRTWKTSAS